MPLATHSALWSKAPSKVLTQSPYAALLVSMHGRALYARRDTDEPDTDEVAGGAAASSTSRTRFQADLRAKLGESEDRANRNQVLVWALDFLSLAPLMGWIPNSIPGPDPAWRAARRPRGPARR